MTGSPTVLVASGPESDPTMPPLDDATREAIRADIEATAGTPDGSVRKIAARHDVSTATVRRVAKAAHLVDPWSRDSTEKASRARSVDLAAERLRLQERWARKANEALDRSEQACTVFSFGGQFNEYAEHTMELPPAADYRSFVTAAAVATDKMVALAKYDAGDDGVAAAVSTIENIMDALRGNPGD